MNTIKLVAEELLQLAIHAEIREFKTRFVVFSNKLNLAERQVLLQRLSSLCKKDLATLYWLATSFAQSNLDEEAIFFFEEITSIDPDKPEILYQKSISFFRLFQVEKAITCILRAIDLSKNVPEDYYFNLGNFYHSIGELQKAQDNFEHFIQLKKDSGIGHQALSSIIKYKDPNNQHLKSMNELFLASDHNDDDKMFLSYALSKAFDDLKDTARSFYFLEIANTIKRKKVKFSISTVQSQFNAIKKIFSNPKIIDLVSKARADSNCKPIFIVGMPRSGTTLVEQIISSHSKVKSTGESMILPGLIKKHFPETDLNKFEHSVLQVTDQKIKNFKDDYLQAAFSKFDERLLTDKLPFNFIFIGFVKLFLPQAKIIHCSRNKYATCLSILKNYFDNDLLGFAYDQTELAQYYKLYYEMMNFWDSKFPNSFFTVEYERLIGNFDETTKKLIDYCDLEWEDSCKKFYKNSNPVVTVSTTQVRQNIYNTSVDSWKEYSPLISRMIKELN
jgi:tetratricopeptide (TPR) repeat protein